MTPINAATAVALFIRQQTEALRSSAHERARPAKRDASASSGQKPSDVATLVFRRIRFIEPTDPDRKRKAFRIFIESVLLFELGEELVNDPKFYELADEVQSRMLGDPGLVKSIDEAGDLLLGMQDDQPQPR
jgi:hypothetical protein